MIKEIMAVKNYKSGTFAEKMQNKMSTILKNLDMYKVYLTFQKNANYSVIKDFNNSSYLFYEYLLCTKIRGLLSHLTLTLTF